MCCPSTTRHDPVGYRGRGVLHFQEYWVGEQVGGDVTSGKAVEILGYRIDLTASTARCPTRFSSSASAPWQRPRGGIAGYPNDLSYCVGEAPAPEPTMPP